MRNSANQTRHQFRTVAAIWLASIAVIGSAVAAVDRAVNGKTETISLYVNVERDGKLITGLQRSNFRLYEDGKSREFRLEKPEEPASIAFLVEHSASSSAFLEDIAYLFDGLQAEGHWYALATYANTLEIHTDFTKQLGEITQTYAGLGPATWNEINIDDAVYDMLDKMGRLPGRRILVVVGSGIDTFSEHNMEDVKKKIEADNVTVFAAGLGSILRGASEPYMSASGQMQLIQAQAFLQMLASKSGGFAWFPTISTAFHDVTEGILQSISTQYRIVYDSKIKGTGKFKKIKLEAFTIANDKRQNFKVLVREGWR